MNVLVIHNRYREPGGEERSVAQITALLRERGHRVELLERSSANASRYRAARAMLAGGCGSEAVAEAVRRFNADVVHAHNINPLFGQKALAAARDAGATVVMHLHNYRLVCAVATTYRDGDPCTECRGRNTFPGLRHRCRGGPAEASIYATAIARQQPRVLDLVDRFVVPSSAAIDQLGALGLPTDKMDALLNFLSDADFVERSQAGDGRYALYVGRLTEEKGVETAITACSAAGVHLVVAGDGPDRRRLESIAARGAAEISFVGFAEAGELARLRAEAAFVLAPSRWAEPCPYAVIEAMAAGLPVLASTVGGLPEMVGPESVVAARDDAGWVEAVASLWGDADTRQRAGQQALDRARKLFSAERFYSGLMSIYESARS